MRQTMESAETASDEPASFSELVLPALPVFGAAAVQAERMASTVSLAERTQHPSHQRVSLAVK